MVSLFLLTYLNLNVLGFYFLAFTGLYGLRATGQRPRPTVAHTPLTLLARQARPGTTHDGSGTKAETYSSISATNQDDVPIKSSTLLCLNLILFCSKSCKLKTFAAVISRVFIFLMNGPSQKALDIKWSPL